MADQNRAAFELWYVGHTFDNVPPELERDSQGHYILAQTRSSWNAWHAGWITGRNDLVNEMEETAANGPRGTSP